MSTWKSALLGAIHNLEQFYDERKFALQQRLGLGKVLIQPYLGYGNRERFYLKARVLNDQSITSAMDDDSVWENLLNMYKRYQSEEIPFARVRATLGNVVREVTADDEGYVSFELEPPADLPVAEDMYYDVGLELLDYPGKGENYAEPQVVKATGKVIVPPPDAQFGVISDIDDTVMRTDVLDLLAMARNTFLMNARTRLPFEGVAAFYQALRRGHGGGLNPIFYVSSSAWNLYDMLYDFFVVRGIPIGPLFLVDLGIDDEKFITPGHRRHKVGAIEKLLATYPDLKFILIGDSTQKDPSIYLEIIERHPGRILASYIRDVALLPLNKADEMAVKARGFGVEMLTVKDTVAAAVHAATNGYIDPAALPSITADSVEDKQAPTPIEQAVLPGKEGEPRTAQTTDPDAPPPAPSAT